MDSEAHAQRRFLQYRNYQTGEISRPVEVTGKSDREIERIARGMLINIGESWLVDDVQAPSIQENG